MRTWFVALSLLASAPALAEHDPGSIVVQERRPIAFLLGTPTGDLAKTRSSDIIRIISEQLQAHTNFFSEIVDPNLLSKCAGMIGCMVETVRDEYVYADSAGLTFDQVQRKLARENVQYPKYLLIVSNVAIEGRSDRLSVVVVDTDVALSALHSADRKEERWRDEVEASLSTAAVVFGPERTEVKDSTEMADFIDRLFSRSLWRVFEKTGNWEPYGTVELRGVKPGWAISLDGQTVGTTTEETTTLVDIVGGLRRFRIEHPSILPFEVDFDVSRGKTNIIDVTAVPSASPAASTARTLVFWTGVGLAVVGAAVTVLGVTQEDSDVKTYCFASENSRCASGSRFGTLGYDASLSNSLAPDVNPSGLMVAPLGYSLFGAGAAFSLGTLLSPESDVPWIPLVAGVAVGALAYGLSGALQGEDPIAR